MRNIATIDLKNPSNNGDTQCGSNENWLQVCFITLDSMNTNIKVQVIGTNGNTITSESLEKEGGSVFFTIPMDYWKTAGTMRVRLISAEENSDYYSFIVENDLLNQNEIVCDCYGETFHLLEYSAKVIYELPIATATILGGVKIGETLTITDDGVLNVVEGSGGGSGSDIEIIAITEAEIDEITAD